MSSPDWNPNRFELQLTPSCECCGGLNIKLYGTIVQCDNSIFSENIEMIELVDFKVSKEERTHSENINLSNFILPQQNDKFDLRCNYRTIVDLSKCIIIPFNRIKQIKCQLNHDDDYTNLISLKSIDALCNFIKRQNMFLNKKDQQTLNVEIDISIEQINECGMTQRQLINMENIFSNI